MAGDQQSTGGDAGQGAEQQTGTEQQTGQPAGADPQGGTDQQGDDKLGDAGKRALQAERDRADQAEKESRRLARELAAAQRKGLTEAEQALADAKDAGRAEATSEFGKKLTRRALDAAVKTRNPDGKVDDILDLIDLEKFIGEDGEPNDKLIEKAVSRFIPEPGPSGPPSFDAGNRQPPPGSVGMSDIIRRRAGRGGK